MKSLIVEDEFSARTFLQEVLGRYGPAHVAVNGKEAVDAVQSSLEAGEKYDLICLDIMMPEMDGQVALKNIRDMEEARGLTSTKGAKIIMTTALDDMKNAVSAYWNLCDTYLVKPIDWDNMVSELQKLGLIEQ